MSDLTREEIWQACEAVGWEWHDPKVTPGGGDGSYAWDGVEGRFPIIRRRADRQERHVADAIALVEAWRCLTFENPYRQAVITIEDPPSVRLREPAFDDNGEPAGDWEEWEHTDIDLSTAAVRAVNKAAEKEATGNA